MQSKIISLNEIDKSIIIPIYQRLYEWEEGQIRALLDDILNANEEYFIGTITTSLKNDELVIIDGQQRLSTIFFLCAYMCYENNKMMKAEGEFANAFNFAYLENECRFKMPLREDIVDAIWDYDFHNLGENIDNAFKTFKEYFKDNDKSKLNEKLFKNIRINLVILDGINCGNYFISMNSNSQALDESDILKSFLLKLVKGDEKYFEYSSILNECMQMNKIADFDTKYEALSIGEILDLDIKECKAKEFKSIVDYPTFVLHVFRILFGDEIKIDKTKFLENTWEKIKHTKENAIKIIEALKEYRSVFDKFVIKNKQGDDENNYRLYGRYKNEKLELIQNYLRVARRGDNNNYHHFLTNLLRYAKDNPYPNQIYLYLKNLDTALAYELLDKNNDNTLLSVAEEFQGKFIEYNMSKISFNILNKGTNTQHYWFYRLEYYLLTTYKWNEKQTERIKKEFKFRYLNSVEHILARQEEYGEALQNQEFLDVFGNIALISKSENSSYSNQNFKKKQIDFNKNQLSSLKLLDVYSYKNWDSDKIKEHQTKMLEILKNSFKD